MNRLRKYIGICIIAAAVISMTACSSQQPAEETAAADKAKTETVTEAAKKEAAQTETAKAGTEKEKETPQETAGLANPMVEVKDSSEFEKQLGIKIDASKLHTPPKMFIIDGKVADLSMELTNVDDKPVEYRLRATKDAALAPTMHGIYDELKDIGTIDHDFNGTKVSISQKESKDGRTAVHTWQVGDVYYSLVINNSFSQMQYAEVMDSIFMAIGIDPNAQNDGAAGGAEGSSDDELVGMANPMQEVTAQQLSEKLGFDFKIPAGAKDVKYYIYNNELGEARFDLNGVKMTARMMALPDFENISGMYYEWDAEQTAEIKGRPARIMRYIGEDGYKDVFLWFDEVPGMVYSLAAEAKDLSGFDIQAVAEEMFEPLQGES